MTPLDYVALVLAVTAGFAYFNHYVLKLPRSSGLLVIALIVSIGLRIVETTLPGLELASAVHHELSRFDFSSFLLNWSLGFLLFAGAINVDVKELLGRKWTILALSTVGVILSTVVVAGGMFTIFRVVGLDVPFSYCLVFGALISPTDPVTVLNVLGRLGIPPRLQAIIAGESMFNDGIGIVLYSLFLMVAIGDGHGITVATGVIDFLREAGGGVILGLVTGGLAFIAMRGIDEYNIELMITLTLVTGTFGIAQSLGVSGPVAVVVAGLLIGSVGAKYAVSGTTQDYLQKFWTLTDELLNAVLFLLIGLEFAIIQISWTYVAVAALAIPLALLARGLSIAVASLPLNLGAPHKARAITLMTWSGLRGGISVALVLALPSSPYREALVTACYGVAIFTMIVQGLSLGPLARRLYPVGGGGD